MRNAFELVASDEASACERRCDDPMRNEQIGDEQLHDELRPEHRPNDTQRDWQTVHRALRTIALRRAALDADEARWLRKAEALQIWRPLGMVSMVDYLERVLGHAPRTAQDRLRVARALGGLPALTAALASGELLFSAVRELTRVATPVTEQVWLAAARGKNLRQVEELVASHHPGDGPDDPPDPDVQTHVVRFELSAETFALLRQARGVIDDEHGSNVADDAFVATLCDAVLDGTSTDEPTGRAKHQVAVTVCAGCRQGWQEGAGVQVPIGDSAVERAMCDAQHIGSLDGDAPERAYQDIAPSVARFVWRRDGGRCRVPGCRSARGIELHHLLHREHGGTHDASNLCLLCFACHQSHHAGVLTISGTAKRVDVRRPAVMTPRSVVESRTSDGVDAHVGVSGATSGHKRGPSVVASTNLDTVIVHAQAKEALIGLGWKPAVVHAAISAAVAAHGPALTLEQMIRESLRRCPVPRA